MDVTLPVRKVLDFAEALGEAGESEEALELLGLAVVAYETALGEKDEEIAQLGARWKDARERVSALEALVAEVGFELSKIISIGISGAAYEVVDELLNRLLQTRAYDPN